MSESNPPSWEFQQSALYHAACVQGLEPGRAVNGIAKVHDLPFIVADFASDDSSAMHSGSKSWHDTKFRVVARRLGSHELLYFEHALQTPCVIRGHRKRPRNDDLIAYVTVGFTAALSNRSRHVKEEATNARLYPLLGERVVADRDVPLSGCA